MITRDIKGPIAIALYPRASQNIYKILSEKKIRENTSISYTAKKTNCRFTIFFEITFPVLKLKYKLDR